MHPSKLAAALCIAALPTSLGCASDPTPPGGPADASDGAPPLADAGADRVSPLEDAGPDAADAAPPDGAIVFDLGADFSFVSNPNGVWRYGYTVGNVLTVDQFRLDTFPPEAGAYPIGIWHPTSDPTAGYYPYVGANLGSVSATAFDSWTIRAREIAMEGSNSGQYSVVELVAPLAGTYQVHAHFEGVHYRLSTTDVHVLSGDASLFSAIIDGYGGDPAFHAVEGASPTADYVGSVALQANDVLTFAIGYGANLNYANDTTSLTAHVVYLSK